MIRFRFISSGDGASYEVLDYGKPHHGVRLEIQMAAEPYYRPDGTSRWNYAEEEYQKYIVDTCGYMHWHKAEPIPWPIIVAFNKMLVERYAAAKAKYPDMSFSPLILVKGRFHLSPEDWETVIREDLS